MTTSTKFAGRLFILKLEVAPNDYQTLGGCTSHSASRANEGIDTTDKQDGRWRKMIPGGVRTLSISASGRVSDDTVYEFARQKNRDDEAVNAMICYADGQIIHAPVLIGSLELTGEFNGAQEFSMSFESAGQVTDLTIAAVPALAFDFAQSQGLAPVIGSGPLTFTRAGSATARGFDGTIQLHGPDVPRFEYDANGNCLGLLIEGARTNLLTSSAGFETPNWGKNNVTVSGNAAASPTGAVEADRVISTANNTLSASARSSAGLSGVLTFSVFYKFDQALPANARYCSLFFRLTSGAGDHGISVDSQNPLTVVEIGASVLSSSVTAYGEGWHRYTITVDTGAESIQEITAIRFNNTNTPLAGAATGDSTNGVLVWGAQLEQAPFASSYIPTTAAAVTRAADDCVGLFNRSGPATLFAEYVAPFASTSQRAVASVSDGTINNRVELALGVVPIPSSLIVEAGVLQSSQSLAPQVNQGDRVRTAMAFSTNDAVLAHAGGITAPDTSVSVPATTELRVGENATGAAEIYAPISQAAIYNTRLSNAQLQALTEV